MGPWAGGAHIDHPLQEGLSRGPWGYLEAEGGLPPKPPALGHHQSPVVPRRGPQEELHLGLPLGQVHPEGWGRGRQAFHPEENLPWGRGGGTILRPLPSSSPVSREGGNR